MFSDIEFIKDLDSGSFSKINVIKSCNDFFVYKKYQIKEKEFFNREIKILSKVRESINVIKLVSYDVETLSIIMEYSESEDLFNIMNDKKYNKKNTEIYMRQMINGLNYIHSNDIAHLDIKLENIILTKDNIIKYIDFNLSCHKDMTEDCLSKKIFGTLFYFPPEYFTKKYIPSFEQKLKIDIWCLGIVFLKLFCGLDTNLYIFEENFNIHNVTEIPAKNKKINFKALEILKYLLNENYEERLKIEEVKTYFDKYFLKKCKKLTFSDFLMK